MGLRLQAYGLARAAQSKDIGFRAYKGFYYPRLENHIETRSENDMEAGI